MSEPKAPTPIAEVYPQAEWAAAEIDEFDIDASDYLPLLTSYGYKVVESQHFGQYQGDTTVVLRDGDRWGWLVFGWGSCTVCDALQACDSYEELDELRRSLHDDIVWRDSAEELATYLEAHDHEGEWYWHEDDEDLKPYLARVVGQLRAGTIGADPDQV